MLRRLARLPMPTIAAIDGPALGGGLELALACDLRVCRSGVTLGLTESRLGGLAGNGSVRLARLVGPARAKEMLFTGETIRRRAGARVGAGEPRRRARDPRSTLRARSPATIAARGPLSNRLAKKLVDAAQDDAARRRACRCRRSRSSDLRERRPARRRGRFPRQARRRASGTLTNHARLTDQDHGKDHGGRSGSTDPGWRCDPDQRIGRRARGARGVACSRGAPLPRGRQAARTHVGQRRRRRRSRSAGRNASRSRGLAQARDHQRARRLARSGAARGGGQDRGLHAAAGRPVAAHARHGGRAAPG